MVNISYLILLLFKKFYIEKTATFIYICHTRMSGVGAAKTKPAPNLTRVEIYKSMRKPKPNNIITKHDPNRRRLKWVALGT